MKRDDIRSVVRGAIERRRQAIVFYLAKRIAERANEASVIDMSPTAADGEWMAVESLSQLRSIVGGRFQKLKERWLAAGFPLREHRGDREGTAELDTDGWVELSVWISRQGYRARLAKEEDPWLFEIAPVEENSGE